MIRRRTMLLGAASLAASPLVMGARKAPGHFVVRDGKRLLLNGKPYRFAGTNLWYGAYLGSFAAGRTRLCRELDKLASLGLNNFRVLGASEDSPLMNSMKPAIRGPKPPWREDLLAGLDFLLAEMAKRDQKAVVFLNNFWEWSGGMVTYLYWTNGGHYINLGDPAHPWPEFADFSATFYKSGKANALYLQYVDSLIGRRNTVTGKLYRDDPAIMAWQLANEPRPGGSEAKTDFPAFYAWIATTAEHIKRHDPNHLVSTGNEGLMGSLNRRDCVVEANRPAAVDYITFHIWPLNWSWIDPGNFPGTYEACEAKTGQYVADHLAIADELDKPLVAEEFGLPRDGGGYAPSLTTVYRDRFYGTLFKAVENSARQGGPFVGTNFWAWGGEGRAQHDDFLMKPGDTAFVGDPPQEPQGRNSVFDSDASTCAVVKAHADALAALR
jgi:mannan endo-1,4-beta-mannosidase